MEGSGARVVTVDAAHDGPMIVEASHRGGGNFIVELVGRGSQDLLVNEIGPYRGTVLAEDVTRGRYRVRVEADGAWSLRHRQPDPAAAGPGILRTFAGDGSEVLAVRAPDDLTPIVAARHGGDGSFVVTLVAYGDRVSGRELLFNEIGAYRGETLTAVPEGDYLLAVIADGPWSVRFRR